MCYRSIGVPMQSKTRIALAGICFKVLSYIGAPIDLDIFTIVQEYNIYKLVSYNIYFQHLIFILILIFRIKQTHKSKGTLSIKFGISFLYNLPENASCGRDMNFIFCALLLSISFNIGLNNGSAIIT